MTEAEIRAKLKPLWKKVQENPMSLTEWEKKVILFMREEYWAGVRLEFTEENVNKMDAKDYDKMFEQEDRPLTGNTKIRVKK